MRRLSAVMREDERVTPLELFFDLVFVLALTQCTTLIVHTPTWGGVLKGLLVLGMLWWSWVGYAWLTSVVDPEEGTVRLVIFVAMAAFLVAAICVPRAFGSDALLFACAYAVVRAAHIVLFTLASREDDALRSSVRGLAVSTVVGAGLLLDAGGPFLFGQDGWKLVPGHFAERHGAVLIIALGESVVALGVGAQEAIGVGVVLAAVLGIFAAATLWWIYFDVTAIVARRRLAKATEGHERNGIARDSYSYLHFPMIAGIALLAVGLKLVLAHVDSSLALVPSVALLGGTALYLLAHVAFRLRNMHTLSLRRLLCAAVLLALVPLHASVSALALLGILTGLLAALIAYEAIRYADARDRIRHELSREPVTD
jgi:low temperature requirement protein LtrA